MNFCCRTAQITVQNTRESDRLVNGGNCFFQNLADQKSCHTFVSSTA